MTKFAIITDTHAGVRADADNIAKYQDKFYRDFMFPTCVKLGINHILHGGDFFDKRQHITIKTMHNLNVGFLQLLKDYDFKMTVILGNHDVYYRNTNVLNAAKFIFNQNPKITLVENFPLEVENILMVPWINRENYESFSEVISNSNCKYMLGHLEIDGFEMHKGSYCEGGMDSAIFKKYEKVFSGHFHTKSSRGNINYLGSTFQFTWADFNEERGFHVFDTETGLLEFYPNPEKLFYKCEHLSGSGKDAIYQWIPEKPEHFDGKIIKILYEDVIKHKLDADEMKNNFVALGADIVQVVEKSNKFSVDKDKTDEAVAIDSRTHLEVMRDIIIANTSYSDADKIKLVSHLTALYMESEENA